MSGHTWQGYVCGVQSLASLPGQLAEGQNFGKGCWRRQHCQLGLQPGPRLSRLLGDRGIHFTGFKCFSRLVGDRVIHYIGSKLELSTIPLAFVFSELFLRSICCTVLSVSCHGHVGHLAASAAHFITSSMRTELCELVDSIRGHASHPLERSFLPQCRSADRSRLVQVISGVSAANHHDASATLQLSRRFQRR